LCLGVWLAPDENNSEHLKVLWAVEQAAGRNIQNSKLIMWEVSVAFAFMVRPSLKINYAEQLFPTKRTTKSTVLSASYLFVTDGFQSKHVLPMFVWFSFIGCFGFTNMYIDQGVSHLSPLLGHLRFNN
jgi:hypothetical protein